MPETRLPPAVDPVDAIQTMDDARSGPVCLPQGQQVLRSPDDQDGVGRLAGIV
jgi:hypothetical protein